MKSSLRFTQQTDRRRRTQGAMKKRMRLKGKVCKTLAKRSKESGQFMGVKKSEKKI